MKLNPFRFFIIMAGVSLLSFILTFSPVHAACGDIIRLSCSAQVFEALQGDGLDLFSEKNMHRGSRGNRHVPGGRRYPDQG